MREVKMRSNFFANVERLPALESAASLEKRLEYVVAAWLRDTGLWGSTFVIEVEPVSDGGGLGAIRIQAIVNVDEHPYLVEKLNGNGEVKATL